MQFIKYLPILALVAILGCTSTSKDLPPSNVPQPRTSPAEKPQVITKTEQQQKTLSPKLNTTQNSIAKWRESVIALNVEMGDGEILVSSGFFISPQVIVSAYHSVEGDVAQITVIWDEQLQRKNGTAQVWKSDAENDVVLLKLDQQNPSSSHLKLAKEETILGEPVVILGFPEITQLDEEVRHIHLFTGHVASVMPPYGDYPAQVVLDARIFGGNSGGPVVAKSTGEVVGIISQVVFDHEEEEHALPSGKIDWRSVEGESMGVAIPTSPIFQLLQGE